jgi:transposase
LQKTDIRKMYFMEGLSIREINRRTGIHRDTISKYISLEEPKPPKYKLTKERTHPVLGPYIPMIKQIIEDDKTRHRKQRCFLQVLFAESCKLKMQNVALCIFHSFAVPDFR